MRWRVRELLDARCCTWFGWRTFGAGPAPSGDMPSEREKSAASSPRDGWHSRVPQQSCRATIIGTGGDRWQDDPTIKQCYKRWFKPVPKKRESSNPAAAESPDCTVFTQPDSGPIGRCNSRDSRHFVSDLTIRAECCICLTPVLSYPLPVLRLCLCYRH